jgi:zinc D-Ala-D-Ala carboxypeptidase
VEDTNLPEITEPLKDLTFKDLPNAAGDIPTAVRELPIAQPRQPLQPRTWLWWLGGVGGVVLVAIGLGLALRSPLSNANRPGANSSSGSPKPGSATSPVVAAQASSVPGSAAGSTSPSPTVSPALLGHLPYAEAPKEELTPITPDGGILMRKVAAEKFLEMQNAARAAGVELVPISGFRSMEDQSHVFFDVKAERGQTPATRAEVSAPPGYSEHHTGYAVDLGDGARPDLNLQTEFDASGAYEWLKTNAVSYNFELSFPKDNPQHVSYEPWHWRFVGDRQSLETFYRARSQAGK